MPRGSVLDAMDGDGIYCILSVCMCMWYVAVLWTGQPGISSRGLTD